MDIAQLVADAQAFYNSLSTSQRATLQKTYTTTLARKWSNLPCGSNCRNGIQLGSLNAAQLLLAQKVIQDVLGTSATNGYSEYTGITLSEDALVNAGGNSSQYNSGLRWLAFLNAPSTTDGWMLQFGGHHYAANIAFNNGHVNGVTPFFVALEPTTFTLNGTTYGPMEDERDALRTMLASLSASELATAKLNTTFGDCLMSPGESNGNNNTFPTTKQGIAVSGLTAAQKALVLAAIETYVSDLEETTADAIMATYTAEIDQMYIAYTGNGTSGNATSFLTSNSNYVRIDGPTVWIEFACQNGVVIQNQIHYHSVWRDHVHDYGVDLSGEAIDVTTGTNDLQLSLDISIFPNPSTDQITIFFPEDLKKATITVFDMMGKAVYNKTHSGATTTVDVHSLPLGNYILKAQEGDRIYSGKFVRN
ncbi:MAG: DUF3500 domain-containing protein [Saprospiraceae bacterium]|nr:DUF3500 domain-containing protein [Saprospiraceae bacterium]